MGTRRGSAGARKPIYVEAHIRAGSERVWDLSQDPGAHPRWDLRFSRIIPIGRDDGGHVEFRYEFNLPLHTIRGTGTSLGHRVGPGGRATSVLKFATTDPISPIGQGSGYWRYVPTEHGTRFMTGYDYRPGMGALGRILDPWVIRPALGWATAVSFDRLRIWAESGVDPRVARNRWLADAGARTIGVIASDVLLRRARAGGSATPAALALTVAAMSWLVPCHPAVPRAGRCLRRSSDPRSVRAPSSLADLPEPRTAARAGR